MTMNDVLSLAQALAMGVLLGAIFFGGLWWTLHKSFSSTQPGLWIAGSLFLRTGVTLAGFYLVARGHWENPLACLVGFIAARLIVIRLTRVTEKPTYWAREAGHAPYSR